MPAGTRLLEAAERIGVQVPHYCYHAGLPSVPAMCRLCLVEVEGAPKLLPSCATTAQEGQVVHTASEKAETMRRGVLEFYLVNHPLDCPVCDQSGECKLQDYVFEEGRSHGRSREPKRVFGRDDFGGDVLFYGDRCVMCTRCVRFMNEVAEDPVLTVVERGSRSVIDTFFEKGTEGSPFAGNIVDICPVGALVSKDFLHKARAWDLDRAPSICPNCSQGCNIDLHVRDNLVQRLKPRPNMDVNGHWMCDYGRRRYEWMNRGDRLEAPLVRGEDGGMTAMAWEEALQLLLLRLGEVRGGVKAVVSPHASNEDLGALARLARAVGAGEAPDMRYRMREAEEEIVLPGFRKLARRVELAPNSRGADLLGATRVGAADGSGGLGDLAGHDGAILVLGDELADQEERFGSEAELFVYLGPHPAAAVPADFILPTTTFAEQEGTFTNVQGRVQRFRPGLRAPGAARPPWLVVGALAAELTGDPAPHDAAGAFLELGARVEAFRDLSYEELGTGGAFVKQPPSLPED